MQKSAMRTGSTSLTLHDARDGCSHDARPHVATHRRAWIETSRVAKVNCGCWEICTAHHSAKRSKCIRSSYKSDMNTKNELRKIAKVCETVPRSTSCIVPFDSMAFAHKPKSHVFRLWIFGVTGAFCHPFLAIA